MHSIVRVTSTLVALLLSIPSHALILQGEGYGKNEQEARKQALSALSETIFVDVLSETEIRQERGSRGSAKQVIRSRSDLPIIGAEITTTSTQQGDYRATATLDTQRAQEGYQRQLDRLQADIDKIHRQIGKMKQAGEAQLNLLRELLTLTEQFQKHLAVATILGAQKERSELPLSKVEIENRLQRLQKQSPSLSFAAQQLSKGIDKTRIYIYPAMAEGSHEVTQLGRLLSKAIAKHLNTTTDLRRANFLLRGEYEILKNGISVNYRLLDRNGNSTLHRSIGLDPSAYKGIDFEPKAMSFDQILHSCPKDRPESCLVLNNDFRAELTTNRGSEDLLFEERDEVEILVKLNHSGYFYIVGHTRADGNESSSYLLEQSDEQGKYRFLRHVSADQVNRWLSLGRFSVEPPFGIESLQMIAATEEANIRLPRHFLNQQSGYYQLGGSSEMAVINTRGLKPKRKNPKSKPVTAETVLMFTTMRQE